MPPLTLRWVRILAAAAAGWFLLLATIHYFNQRPLWNDEACVFNSIRDYTPQQLFSLRLQDQQAFPRFYLWCIQSLSRPFHDHVLALRFLAFVSMLAGFFVWFNIARRSWGLSKDLLTFVLCWGASMPLIYYAAELKPYSMDVLVCAVFIWALCAWHRGELKPRALVWLPAFGLVSYPAFFLMPLVFYELGRASLADRSCRKVLAAYTLMFLASVFYLYYFDLRVSTAGELKQAWGDYFISFTSVGEFFKTFGEGVNNLISRWFVERPKWLRAAARVFMGFGFAYFIYAGVAALRRHKARLTDVLAIGFALFLELLVLGALHQYPFTVPRTSLFFAPVLLFATVEALRFLRGRAPVVYWPFQAAFWAYLAYVSVGIAGVVFAGDLGAQSVIWASR